MKIFTDFTRVLRKAKISYKIISNKVGHRQIMVDFTKDYPVLTQGRFQSRNTCILTFTPDYYVAILSYNSALAQNTSGLKRHLSVEAFCFKFEDLLEKLKKFGYLSGVDIKKLTEVTKDGYGYVRKKKVVKKIKKAKPESDATLFPKDAA